MAKAAAWPSLIGAAGQPGDDLADIGCLQRAAVALGGDDLLGELHQ